MKVLELFAGVGGFRIGLENSNADFFKTMWSNQWEPSKKSQDAFDVYNLHYGNKSKNFNCSIESIPKQELKKMDADLIVGGFPCQDYSVARSKKNEMGIEGKKGVLFWEIIRLTKIIKPQYLILENVDRLLKSPSSQRGRDFGIMLSAFNSLKYSVEWRVINASEYGGVQRRKRIFCFVYKNTSVFGKFMNKKYSKEKIKKSEQNILKDYIYHDGLFARQFKINDFPNKNKENKGFMADDIFKVSENFSDTFWNTGIMRYGYYFTSDTIPTIEELEKLQPLKSILQPTKEIEEKYYINNADKLEKFKYLRGSKKEARVTKEGHEWFYTEGSMSPFEDINLPSRTMLTSEGSVNRSTHLLKFQNKYRVLTPIECERLNYFPDNWTKYKLQDGKKIEVSDRMRYFFMGNALVTSIVTRIGDELQNIENYR